MAVLHVTLCGIILLEGSLGLIHVDNFIVTHSGSFTYNADWHIYFYHQVAVLRILQGGRFTCTAGWQF